MSDDENGTEMLPSPSYVHSDDDEQDGEGGGDLPASPTHDPEDDDDENVPASPTTHHPTTAPDDAPDETEAAVAAPAQNDDDLKWYASYDDEGRVYYYNIDTQETSWDAPAEGFHPPPEQEGAETATAVMETEETAETQQEPAVAAGWVAYQDDEGREYYYNAETGETQWEKPEGYIAPVTTKQDDEQEPPQPMDATTTMPEDEAVETTTPADASPEEEEQQQPEEEEIDPEVLKLQHAEAALEQPDSVMERTCIANVAEVAKRHGGNPEHALAKLVENYQGQAAVCGLLGQWLCRLKASNNMVSANNEFSETSAAAADEIRESIQDTINRVTKENFSKDVGDEILNLSSEDASFLQEMINSSRWRKLLIDLSASHKESAVLKLCLKRISKGGHHREIARRINQSEHFSVFHQMLQSELTAIGRLSVSAGSDMSIGFTELVRDLERACTSTSYTYLYSLEMIRALIDSVDITQVSPRFQRAVRKWEVLAQILEETLVDPNSIGSSSSPLFQKRRLDVASTINELHQRQGKRQRTNGDSSTYEKALLDFLRKHAMGIQVADSLLDPLLPSGLDLSAGQDVGRLLIEHPLAVRALLGHLYKPGQTRVTNPSTKNKSARLVALSVLAAEERARAECPTLSQDLASDEVALTTTILQGAQLCEQLESMISFLVVSTPKTAHQPGPKLVVMAQECAAVAQGIMIWAKDFTRGTDFSGSASFPTLSVCILSLVRVVAINQAFTRKEAIEIALQFLGHSNSDISYKKVSEIKEQSLRLLVFLLVKGEVVGVLEAVMKMVAKKGSSDLDASLIRYFVGGIVAVVQPPVSFIFARLFVKLLRSPSCVDAVRSKYFPDESRVRLGILLKSFQQLKSSLADSVSKDDQTIFDAAVSLYQVE